VLHIFSFSVSLFRLMFRVPGKAIRGRCCFIGNSGREPGRTHLEGFPFDIQRRSHRDLRQIQGHGVAEIPVLSRKRSLRSRLEWRSHVQRFDIRELVRVGRRALIHSHPKRVEHHDGQSSCSMSKRPASERPSKAAEVRMIDFIRNLVGLIFA
jgi:hypothetical protein